MKKRSLRKPSGDTCPVGYDRSCRLSEFQCRERDDLLRQKAKETNADAEVISYDSDKADVTEDGLTDQADKETMGISDNTEVGEAASENTDTTYLEQAALEEM